MTAPESKLDTVRKLLAKAERAVNEHEADAYNRKAEALMAAHGIDVALLAESGAVTDEIGSTRIGIDDPYSQGKGRMLGWIAEALGCRSALHFRRGGKIAAVTVHGHRTDRERVELLYTSLLLQAITQLTRVRPDDTAFGGGESVAAYRRAWLYAYGSRVSARIKAAEVAAAAQADTEHRTSTTGASAALVLVDRKAAVDQAFAEAFPELGRARPVRVSSRDGLLDGDRAGRQATIGSGRGVTARRAPALEG